MLDLHDREIAAIFNNFRNFHCICVSNKFTSLTLDSSQLALIHRRIPNFYCFRPVCTGINAYAPGHNPQLKCEEQAGGHIDI